MLCPTPTLVDARRLPNKTSETNDKNGDIWLIFPKITSTCAWCTTLILLLDQIIFLDSDQSSAKLSFELFCSFRALKAFDFKQIWNKVAEKALFGDFEAIFSEFGQNRQISPYCWWWNFHDIDFSGLYWHDAWNESFAHVLGYLLSPLTTSEHAYPTLP